MNNTVLRMLVASTTTLAFISPSVHAQNGPGSEDDRPVPVCSTSEQVEVDGRIIRRQVTENCEDEVVEHTGSSGGFGIVIGGLLVAGLAGQAVVRAGVAVMMTAFRPRACSAASGPTGRTGQARRRERRRYRRRERWQQPPTIPVAGTVEIPRSLLRSLLRSFLNRKYRSLLNRKFLTFRIPLTLRHGGRRNSTINMDWV